MGKELPCVNTGLSPNQECIHKEKQNITIVIFYVICTQEKRKRLWHFSNTTSVYEVVAHAIASVTLSPCSIEESSGPKKIFIILRSIHFSCHFTRFSVFGPSHILIIIGSWQLFLFSNSFQLNCSNFKYKFCNCIFPFWIYWKSCVR